MSTRRHTILTLALMLLDLSVAGTASARPYLYPGTRYVNSAAQAMGGITVPLTDEIGNSLFNNPAALARSTKFKAEYLNLNLETGSTLNLANGLGAMTPSLNKNAGQVQGMGFSNLTALSWGGLGVGLLTQERGRAVSDGTTVKYETVSQVVPAVGYGLSLARGVIRLGYSAQYVSEATGVKTAPSNKGATFLSGLNQGLGLSHTASFNIVFPFTYLPTFTLLGRNLGGVHYSSGSLLSRATNIAGAPADEKMSFDFAFNTMVRLSATFKSYWYFEYRDFTNQTTLPFLERMAFGALFDITQSFGFKVGFSGIQPSAGLTYKSESSEIGLAWFHESNPFGSMAQESYDTRIALQYKIFFQSRNTRDPKAETKAQ